MSKSRLALMLAISGGACGAANAQAPYLINISGATLQRAYFIAPASTNDFVDVDNDTLPMGPGLPDQLAPFDVSPPYPATQWWQVQYRGTGSVNGLAELVEWGATFALQPGDIVTSAAGEGAWNNRSQYISSGNPTGSANTDNPGAAPSRSLLDGSYRVTTSEDPLIAGIQIDIAPLDVPVEWSVQGPVATRGTMINPGEANPGDPGYGRNPRLATLKDGTPTTQDNLLTTLGSLNLNYANPDDLTVYQTQTAVAPVAAIVSFGVGRQQILQSELNWLFATGRLPNGENLMCITRDSGSGTRNAFSSSIDLDPSYCSGENIGAFTSSSSNDLLGPNYTPSNKGGSSRVEGTIFNTRLGVGQTGAERGVSSGWLSANPARAEVLAVGFDITNGSRGGPVNYVRPTAAAVVNNDPATGYNISGPATWATIGDPKAEMPGFPGFGENSGNPLMRNQQAAAYMNNVTQSIDAFKGDPGGDATVFSPGEFLADTFILPTAVDFVPTGDPAIFQASMITNQIVQDFTLVNNTLASPLYASFNTTSAGLVPTRTTGTVYSDGVANGANYIAQNGATVSYGTALSSRNKISGDFDNDGQRTIDDIEEMVKAYLDRYDAGAPAWQPGTNAVIEILGDFDGNGSFDAQDVRYFADGLALTTTVRGSSSLDRAAGFAEVDNALAANTNPADNNFFNTTLGNPAATYDAGDSRADVIGPSGLVTRGFAPTGADGVVDDLDIDYVYANFGDWSDRADYYNIDLSCDMNGDLVIDQCDVTEVVNILETAYGDANLDGVVDSADLAIVNANFGQPGGWAQGDFNGNGTVDAQDRQWVRAVTNTGDENEDGVVDFTDLNRILASFGTSCPPAPDCGLPAVDCTGDENEDGEVNFSDLNRLLSTFGNSYNP